MRYLICGDRRWGGYRHGQGYTRLADVELSYRVVASLPAGSVIIEGEARGADELARQAAEDLNYEVHKFPANWNVYGRGAGPIRNAQMLEAGSPEVVIYCHPNLKESAGTRDMVRRALSAGVAVYSAEAWLAGDK